MSEMEKLQSENEELRTENANLREQVAYLKKQLFAPKKEKIVADDNQLSLFDEAETEASQNAREEEKEIVVPSHKRKQKRTKDEIFAALPVKEEVIPAENVCPECGSDTVVIGKEYIREEIVFVKAEMYRRQIFREVRKCTVCGTTDEKPDDVIIKPQVPAAMFPKSYCSPELLAHILIEKYAKHVPLERLSKDFRSMGAEISTSTLANWVIEGANTYLKKIYNELHKKLLLEAIIHADETPVQVLHEKGKKPTGEKRMWVYASGKFSNSKIMLYDYKADRKGENAKAFLNGFSGYLVCDGYSGYNKVEGVKRCGCMAHVRRKFFDAMPTDKDTQKASKAYEGVEFFDRIYHFENEFAELSAEERKLRRQEHSKQILDDFYSWLETFTPVGGSKLSSAKHYALSEKANIYRFLEDGNIPVDNNLAERAVKPFVIGRKNWLFSTSPKGADASAICFSIIQTALANNIDPREYLTRVFSGETDLLPVND